MDYIEELNVKGFIVLKNAITTQENANARSCIQGQTMEYTKMKTFIEEVMLRRLSKNINASISYGKFRVSDNNNSIDAGAFHRDIMPTSKSQTTLPIYTCLCYLDGTVMELIPGTHNNLVMSYGEALKTYQKKIRITVEPTDLFIFNSSMIHRGIFTENLEHRRLIQVFNCFLNETHRLQYASQIICVPGNGSYSSVSLALYKNPITGFVPNLFGYFNAATGGGISNSESLKCPFDVSKYRFYSSEGLCERIDIVENTMQKLNLYNLKDKKNTLPIECMKSYMYDRYERQFMFYGLIVLLLTIFVIYLLIKAISYVKRSVSIKKMINMTRSVKRFLR